MIRREEQDGGTPRHFGRRSFLAAGTAGLVLGAAGTELGNRLADGPSSRSGPVVPPDVDLMEEHGLLKRLLLIYQAVPDLLDSRRDPAVSAIHDSALIVHDFIEAFHEALEEGYVFPRLRRAGRLVATVDTLLVQHARGRERTQLILAGATRGGMSTATTRQQIVAAMAAFVRMYQPHEAREDTVVFPAFRALLSAEELHELAETFAGLQRSQFGPNAFAEMVNRVAGIERSLGIYDLNQFTPSEVAP